jgi:hypothetical protein
MARHHHSFAKESFITGTLGALTVAVWFLILDLLAGRPLATPSVLGQVILFGKTEPVLSPIVWPAVLSYTSMHFTAFLIFGMLVTWLVFQADRNGLALFGLFMLTVAFEVFFWGVVTALSLGTTLFPAWSVLTANALAVAVMSGYLISRHPALRRRLAREPLGA